MKHPLAFLLLVGAMCAPAFASDAQFYEAIRACRAPTVEHPFHIRIALAEAGPTYSFEEESPFTECLAREAGVTDQAGAPRRLSLGANLKRAVDECTSKFGQTKSFLASFAPTQTHFAVSIGSDYNKTRACIAMITGMIQPFGATPGGQPPLTTSPPSQVTPRPQTAPAWADQVRAAVRQNIMLAEDVPGNPQAEVDVWLGPQGHILSMTLVASSGVEAWDKAVLNALKRTNRLPLDVDGRIPSRLRLAFRPRGA